MKRMVECILRVCMCRELYLEPRARFQAPPMRLLAALEFESLAFYVRIYLYMYTCVPANIYIAKILLYTYKYLLYIYVHMTRAICVFANVSAYLRYRGCAYEIIHIKRNGYRWEYYMNLCICRYFRSVFIP